MTVILNQSSHISLQICNVMSNFEKCIYSIKIIQFKTSTDDSTDNAPRILTLISFNKIGNKVT